MITHLNFAKGFRGGERQTMLLIQELSVRGYKQKVITRVESELANRLEGTKNLEIIRISKPYFFNLFKVKNDSLLHAHETKAAQFAFFAKMFLKIPYIVTRRVDNPIKNNFFNKKIYENASVCISLSNAIKDEILKITSDANIKIIPSAYSKLSIDENQAKVIKDRFKDKFLLGNIGELDNTHKGQFYLLEAMKKLQVEYPDIHLILLGRGKDEQKYKEQVKDLSNVTFEGFVDNVGDYIKCLDLFVFPSLNEGLGSILFDIMQAKVPIVASNVGGIPDIVTD
ncbi:MAG: glycosyltransferase family 4 protein, partial [Thiovulaceae bacterium]|nr:glycosyltransferase family 4 protein [Sulfurimonadaceae bacterium]